MDPFWDPRSKRRRQQPVVAVHPTDDAPTPGAQGTLIYLDASPSLDDALARAEKAGGRIALPRQALPPGMGFFAHITDLDGNRVGLHALA